MQKANHKPHLVDEWGFFPPEWTDVGDDALTIHVRMWPQVSERIEADASRRGISFDLWVNELIMAHFAVLDRISEGVLKIEASAAVKH